MPFQCLGKKMPDSSFHFLIEDHAIFYTNKMKIFENTRDTIRNMANLYSFAAFGVPDKTLKYNTAEVKEIGKILGIDSTIYADGRATESMAKTSLVQKKYIHFATHGVLNYSNEFSQSYLKFLPDKDSSNGNNGQLTIREIQRLGIRDCNLVILSACETAINKELVKGWNISPANAFLERRVKSVIASLWKVDDEATNILMNEFYKNLKIMSTVDALRLAQQTLSRNPKYSHPFYWGAFVLYGDWR
jgi:CHAT domain-containing protein